MKYILALPIFIALSATNPLPQQKTAISDTKDICKNGNTDLKTKFYFSDKSLNWGDAVPAEILGHLNDPNHDPPCDEIECKKDRALKGLTTSVVDPNNMPVGSSTFLVQKTFTITVEDWDSSYENQDEPRDMQNWINLIKNAFASATSAKMTKYREAPPGAFHAVERSINQNWAPDYFEIERFDGNLRCDKVIISITVDNPEGGGDLCAPILGTLGGVAAGVSGFLGPIAILAGIFGAITPLCQAFGGQ